LSIWILLKGKWVFFVAKKLRPKNYRLQMLVRTRANFM